jgi:hypothetical protein
VLKLGLQFADVQADRHSCHLTGSNPGLPWFSSSSSRRVAGMEPSVLPRRMQLTERCVHTERRITSRRACCQADVQMAL